MNIINRGNKGDRAAADMSDSKGYAVAASDAARRYEERDRAIIRWCRKSDVGSPKLVSGEATASLTTSATDASGTEVISSAHEGIARPAFTSGLSVNLGDGVNDIKSVAEGFAIASVAQTTTKQ